MIKKSILARSGWCLAVTVFLAARVPALATVTVSTESTLPAVSVSTEASTGTAPADAPDPAIAPGSDALLASWYVSEAPPPQDLIPHHPSLSDRFWFGLGAFLATSTTEARLDSTAGVGTNVDFEDLLGLEETTVAPQGLARWRFSDRWRLEFEFFQVDRSHTRTTGQDIDWGDQTFPAGTQLKTEFNVSVTRISCGYSFFKRPDKELGIALGFHLTDIDARLSTSGGNAEGGALLAPLPVLSGYGQFALTDTWALSGRLDAFRIEYDPYKGTIYSIGIDALCQPWRHFGFGFGYRSLQIEASAEGSDWEGHVGANFQGPIVFLTASF